MGDISEHFTRDRLACKCGCGQDTVDVELIKVLEDLRRRFKQPVYVSSGNRCLAYNRTLPDSRDTSQHIKSKATDIWVSSVPPRIVYNYLTMKYPNKYGIGLYRSFVHIDVRKVKARW